MATQGSDGAGGEVIRIVLADDHAVVLEGVRALLNRDPGLEVLAVADNATEAVSLCESVEPDVAVLDVSMKGSSGLDAAKAIKERLPKTRVLMLSMYDDPEYVLEAVKAGADGYILKDANPMHLREAVRVVADGGDYFSGVVAERLTQGVRQQNARETQRSRLDELTAREREVLHWVAKGSTNRQIAEALAISPRTVETHRERLMAKLDIRTVAGLTRLVMEVGEEL